MKYPTVPIETICRAVNVGHVGPSSMHRDPNGVPFLMGKNVGFGSLSTHNLERVTEDFHRSQPKSQIRAGDVLVVRIGKSGQAAKVPEALGEANCSGLVIIKQPLKIDADFLVYFLNSPIGRANSVSQARGSTRLTLNTESVALALVPVPPLPEQRRIVGILDEASDGIATAKANAEKNLQNADALFESHLNTVFTNRGDGWEDKPLETVAMILNGYAFKSTSFSPKECVKCIKITNVGVREFVCESDAYLPSSFAEEYRAVSVKKGSIAIALTRTIIAGGLKVAVVPEEYDGALLNQRVAAIRTDQTVLSDAFLFAYLSTQAAATYVKERVNTLMQPNLSITDLRSMPIPVPPRIQQDEITDHLDTLREESQRLESIYQKKLDALDALKKSLLDQAFTGQL